jgi:hypothetical protein
MNYRGVSAGMYHQMPQVLSFRIIEVSPPHQYHQPQHVAARGTRGRVLGKRPGNRNRGFYSLLAPKFSEFDSAPVS